MAPELIGTISLGRSVELRFEVSPFKGKDYVNIRRFIKSGRYTGYTKKGVTLRPDLALQLLEALERYRQSYESGKQDEICHIPKSETVDIVAHIVPPDDIHDTTCLDVREYVQSDTYTGWTQKGFRLPLEEIDRVIELLKGCLDNVTDKESPANGSSHVREASASYSKSDVSHSLIHELIPEGIPVFPQDFLPTDQNINGDDWSKIELPPEPLILGPMRGRKQEVLSEAGFEYLANNLVEAKYIFYAHQRGNNKVAIPTQPFLVF